MKNLGQVWQKPFFASILTLCVLGNVTPATAGSLSDLFGMGNNAATESAGGKAKPVSVHEAFKVFPEQKDTQLTIRFEVKDGYYLYQNKIKLELPEGVMASPLQFSLAPQTVNDPDFGQVPVFDKNFIATTTLSAAKNLSKPDALVKWQGCAKAGLCYPPEKTAFALANFATLKDSKTQKDKLPPADTAKTNTAVATNTIASSPVVTNQNVVFDKLDFANNAKTSLTATETTDGNSILSSTPTTNSNGMLSSAPLATTAPVTTLQPESLQASAINDNANTNLSNTLTLNDKADNDPFGLVVHPLWAMALLFLAGLGLAFTPCVLPMLPIVANIIARQHKPSAKKGLLLTSGYGLGVATSYGILGAVIAVFGHSLGIMNWLQNPVILLSFAVLFVLLGLYMLDRLPIRLPMKLSHQFNKLSQVGENRLGSVTGSFVTGFFSALVVSPCVSAPLAGALAGVATTGNPVIGFFALFMLGLGLSTPLMLLGATQGNFMPKSGAWMHWVKTGFALLLFAVALLMIERVFATTWMLGLWAVWFAVVAGWAWQWQHAGNLLTKAISLVFGVWAGCLIVGMASGATDSWQPLKPLLSSANHGTTLPNASQRITTLDELAPIVATQQKILVDITADWCIECRIMDKTLFANPPATLQNWQVVKLDVTEDTPESRAVYQQLNVFGPPVLLYFDKGKLVYRQNGEVKRDTFEQALNKL